MVETKIRNDNKNGDRHISSLGVYLHPSAIGLINSIIVGKIVFKIYSATGR